MHEIRQKIVCLVPSWTETLIECGANVVGRSRFCIHPGDRVKNIPAVGGTKDFKLDEILKLQPDLVILDKEENRKEMADALTAKGVAIEVSHVESIATAADFLQHLSLTLKIPRLSELGAEYLEFKNRKLNLSHFFQEAVLMKTSAPTDFTNCSYVIWKNPYMIIGPGTFISEVLSCFEISLAVPELKAKYPQISEEELKKTFCLFSSEPYPFAKDFEKLIVAGFRGLLVDGEKISWYGIRNLRFLQSCSK